MQFFEVKVKLFLVASKFRFDLRVGLLNLLTRHVIKDLSFFRNLSSGSRLVEIVLEVRHCRAVEQISPPASYCGL